MDKRENLGNDSIHSIHAIDVLTPYTDVKTVLYAWAPRSGLRRRVSTASGGERDSDQYHSRY